MIFSSLYYCTLVCGSTGKSNLEKLHVLQKKYIRFIENKSRYDHASPLFPKYKILPITNVCQQSIANYLYHKIKSHGTSFVNRYKRPDCGYAFRDEKYVKQGARTRYGEQSIDYQLPLLLNTFPEIVTIASESKTRYSFKRRAKEVLLRNAAQ